MFDEMKEIVICRDCHNKEYYGMMIWLNGHTYCRSCTYKRWEEDSNHTWKPAPNDFVFPLYSDGVDYTSEYDKEINDTNKCEEEVSTCTHKQTLKPRKHLKKLLQMVKRLLCMHRE